MAVLVAGGVVLDGIARNAALDGVELGEKLGVFGNGQALFLAELEQVQRHALLAALSEVVGATNGWMGVADVLGEVAAYAGAIDLQAADLVLAVKLVNERFLLVERFALVFVTE